MSRAQAEAERRAWVLEHRRGLPQWGPAPLTRATAEPACTPATSQHLVPDLERPRRDNGLSTTEAASDLGVRPEQLKALVRAGTCPVRWWRNGRGVRFSTFDVESLTGVRFKNRT